MEKYAWKGKIKDGALDEHIRRHNEIWPEMVEVLKKAGIRNYTIWNVGNELFGFYACDSISEIVKKWDVYMQDVLLMEKDPITGAQPLFKKVFELD